jgi:glycine dehydrogenase subunit 2
MKLLQIPGLSAPYAEGRRRVEQIRYSWEALSNETGVHTEDLGRRAADFGVHYWTSHHPWLVPEPCTLEPTESLTKEELDEYAAIMAQVAEEARTNPELVKTAPHNSTIHTIDHDPMNDPSQWAVTWRAYRRKVREKTI